MAEQRRIQEEFDKKNAAGAAKELKKSEMVDWKNHATLNKVTKMAIGYFEKSYTFEDYLTERTEKESKLQVGKSGKDAAGNSVPKGKSGIDGSEDEGTNSEDEEEEEDEGVEGWDRAEAERLYLSTRESLSKLCQ